MKNKIIFPVLGIVALICFFSFKYINSQFEGTDNVNAPKNILAQKALMNSINTLHYAPRKVDDSFSVHVFSRILQNLDYGKLFFTKTEIDQLKKFEFDLDDELKNNNTNFFNALTPLFTNAVKRADSFSNQILRNKFTFNTDENLQLDGLKLEYAKNETELKSRWEKTLKYRTLARYVDLKKEQETKKTNKDSIKKMVVKTDEQLEVEARETVKKNQLLLFKRYRKLDEKELFSMYLNSVTATEDPHTDFYPPKEKAKFDEAMSGSFFGIGAQLKAEEDGSVKITNVITGSPSWKQGDLKAGDIIIKVAQGMAEPEDIQGWEIDDVVSKIRGKKGSEVRLTVKRMDGSSKIIPIIRGEVLMEDTYAKSAIIKNNSGSIGYIFLPEFYADFNHTSNRRCAEDIAKEILKLKTENVAAIILDLRNNGGGSLEDVVNIGGMFIDQGPIVQVKTTKSAAVTLNDEVLGTLYDGPLAIMINQNSASASEILAAAMQDYKRAVIVGTRSYGKGTVQQIRSLDDFLNPLDKLKNVGSEIGSIKITIQKFYRINGGSTQQKGVTPDIIFPDIFQYIDMGERREKSSLPWDGIAAASYNVVPNPVNIDLLKQESKKRTAAVQSFNLINENAKKLKQKEDNNLVSLNELKYKNDQEETKAFAKKIEDINNKLSPIMLSALKADAISINRDTASIEKNKAWLKGLSKDLYLSETVNIVADLIKSYAKRN